MDDDGSKDVIGFGVGPCQTQAGGQILQEADDESGNGFAADVTQHMNGSESSHGQKIGSCLRGTVQVPENQTPVQHLFRQGYQQNHADDHQGIVCVGHFGKGGVIDVMEIGQQIIHDKIHDTGSSPVGHIAQYHCLHKIPQVPPCGNQRIFQESAENAHDSEEIHTVKGEIQRAFVHGHSQLGIQDWQQRGQREQGESHIQPTPDLFAAAHGNIEKSAFFHT